MWYFIFYLIAMAENLSVAFLTLWIIAGIIAVVAFLFWTFRPDEGDPDDKNVSTSEEEGRMIGQRSRKLMRIFVPMFAIFLTLYLFIPNRNSLILIVAGGTVGQFLEEDENAREIPSEIFNLLKMEIQQEIQEIKTETVKDELEEMTTEELKEELLRLKKEKIEEVLE
jgi:hypothetical protein